MLIIAHHNVNDPQSFWGAAKELTKSLPANLKLHGVYPSADGKLGTCLWEANTAQEVQQFLDKNAGMFAKNLCYEVNVEQSIGLPKIQMAEAHMN
ncbi:MAG: hypothetical protein ACHQET_09455 [Chitinophagales bacterium]